MNSQVATKRERKYFIDWLRIGLIISVFFFHVGMIFRPEQWHINSEEVFPFLDPIMSWLHLWRMPLLFLVSGIGTYYAIGHRTSWEYIKERFTRLYIPFTFGFFFLVPIQIYIERIDIYNSLWDYYPHMFEGGPYPIGNISWHHLWFIIYLFIISLFISPFLNYTRSHHFKNLRERAIILASRRMGLNWLLPVIIMSQLILRQYFPRSTHALMDDWAYFTYYVLFFISGFTLFTSDKVIQALANQRRLYMFQTLIFTIIMFSFWVFKIDFIGRNPIYEITEISIALSCGLTSIGYFKVYFNKDNRFQKSLNEAIYPFYLLHQPVLVIVGYVVLQWKITSGLHVVLIISISLFFIYFIYRHFIIKFNLLRLVFGLKMNPKRKIKIVDQLQEVVVINK